MAGIMPGYAASDDDGCGYAALLAAGIASTA